MTCLLGGTWSPIGRSVAFIEAPHTAVLERLLAARSRPGRDPEVRMDLQGYPDCLESLKPPAHPRTSELLVVHGITWTAYLTNDPDAEDLWTTCSPVAVDLGVAGIVATHRAPGRDGRAVTSLRIVYPDPVKRRSAERLVMAKAQRGRWAWTERGTPLPFETPEAYQARSVRDRLTRELLVSYLAGMNILVDDDSFFGMATLLRQVTSGRVEIPG